MCKLENEREEVENMSKESIKKTLWLDCGGKCCYEYNGEFCRLDLVDREMGFTYRGHLAHIHSESKSGPRYIKLDDYDTYENQLYICIIHHAYIDNEDLLDIWTPERLVNMKKNHERWVKENPDKNKTLDELEVEFGKTGERIRWVFWKIKEAKEKRDWGVINEITHSTTATILANRKFTKQKKNISSCEKCSGDIGLLDLYCKSCGAKLEKGWFS